MASLSVRDVPESIVRSLKLRAARAGHSMEAEVRALLARATEMDEPDPPRLRGLGRDLLAGIDRQDSVDAFLADRRKDGAQE